VNRLRILHVIPSASPNQGGPSFALPLIAQSLGTGGVVMDVATTDDDGTGKHIESLLGQAVVRNGANYYYFRKQMEFYKVSFPFARWLSKEIRNYDLIHIHALFSFTSCVAAHLAMKNGVPYVIRTLGVLNRWGMLNRRRILKWLSFQLIEKRILRNAAAVHFTSHQEKNEAMMSGVVMNSAVIPLGIDVSTFAYQADAAQFLARFPQAQGRKIVLFLSRIDPKKGLDLLLPAFAELRTKSPECLLVIAGEGAPPFVTELRRKAEELMIADHILWTGFLAGQEKVSAISAATIFVLPSYSENFGIAPVEALAAGLPVVISDQVGVAQDVNEFKAGLVVPCEVRALAKAMQSLITQPELRSRLASNARNLAAKKFSLEAMGTALVDLYTGLLPSAKNAPLAKAL